MASVRPAADSPLRRILTDSRLARALRTASLARTMACAALVFASAFFVYRSNDGNLYTYDSAPNSLLVFNALEHHRLDFDAFRSGFIVQSGAAYVFTDAPTGHYEPIFPIGAALIAAPIQAVQYATMRVAGPLPDLTSADFEKLRLANEKAASVLIGSLAAMLFFLCAIRIATLPVALVTTVAFAFGTEAWTIYSQALWQHGAIAVASLGMIASLLGEPPLEERPRSAFVAGVCAGFLPVIRPTSIVFSFAGAAFALYAGRGRARVLFAAGALLGALPGLVWNLAIFHSLSGGYGHVNNLYAMPDGGPFGAFLGLLVSPSRGILFYMPFVVFSIAGAVAVWRRTDRSARLVQFLTLASLLTFINYCFVGRWEGGGAYGPRYLCEIMPTCALLLTYVMPANLIPAGTLRRVATVVLFVAIAFSVAVQAVGATGEPKTNWSGVPVDLGLAPERVWSWRDSQIERDALASYRIWTDNPTFSAAYADGFEGRIVKFERADRHAAPPGIDGIEGGSRLFVTAVLENRGTSPWYGFASGMYYGQTRLRMRVVDGGGTVVRESYGYLDGSPGTGQRAEAIGQIVLPSEPGHYAAHLDIDVFQNPRIGARRVGLMVLPVTIHAFAPSSSRARSIRVPQRKAWHIVATCGLEPSASAARPRARGRIGSRPVRSFDDRQTAVLVRSSPLPRVTNVACDS